MDSIAGFRLVRRLGAGQRAEVYLGRAPASAGEHDGGARPAPTGVAGGTRMGGGRHDVDEGRTAAIKIFRAGTALASIDAEIEALARASSPFLARLDDLGTDEQGRPVLVLERLETISLAQLILDRDRLNPGEAVTLLAPLIDAVLELHRVGVAHRNIRLASVGFDHVTTPVLMGFGHARIVGPLPLESHRSSLTPAEAAAEPDLAADVDQVLAVARSVLSSTGDGSLVSLAEELARLHTGRDAVEGRAAAGPRVTAAPGQTIRRPRPSRLFLEPAGTDSTASVPADPGDVLRMLREKLFDAADPEPVALVAPDARAGGARVGDPAASIPRMAVSALDAEASPSRNAPRFVLPMWLESMAPHLPGLLGRGEAARGAMPARVQALRTALGTVRRPFWLAAAAACALLIGAIVVTGIAADSSASAAASSASDVSRDDPAPPGTDTATDPSGVASATDGAGGKADAGGAATGGPKTGDVEAGTGGAAETGPARDADVRAALSGDDPVAAAVVLLEKRQECFVDRSVLCLDSVEQPGSAAIEADSYAIRGMQEGSGDPALDLRGSAVSVIEHLGGSALLAVALKPVTPPDPPPAVSLLVVKSESGWRIRDVIVG